ncbi:hypothetical protein [Amycolatopsis taiwanensis]|uniref:hypothetical protein n=1 Tax=Amycolatopsis taiwanensis TaxID=342230 RepID=UPI0004847113|nr:hypothetical protein [Amycolatopsis taiwanensis]
MQTESSTGRPRPGPPKTWAVRLGYTAAGLAIGVAWALGWDRPIWEHALRLLVLVLVVPPIIHLVRRRTGRTAGHPPLRHLVVAKVLLVAAAIGLEVLLDHWTSWSALLTALALTITVAVGGPSLHHTLLRRISADRDPGRDVSTS